MASLTPIGLALQASINRAADEKKNELEQLTKKVRDVLLENARSPEERQRVWVHITQDPMTNWPLAAPNRVIPASTFEFFSHLRDQWCFSVKMPLWTLCSLSLFNELESLSKISNLNKSAPELAKLAKEFAGLSLLFETIFHQKEIWKIIDPKKALENFFQRFHFNSPKLVAQQQAIERLRTAEISTLTSYKKKGKATPSKIEEGYQRILQIFEVGIRNMLFHPYFQQYLFLGSLECFPKKAVVEEDLTKDLSQIRSLARLVRMAWSTAEEGTLVSCTYSSLFTLPDPPSVDQLTPQSAKSFTQNVRSILLQLFSHSQKLFFLFYQAKVSRLTTWEECAKHINLPEKNPTRDLVCFLSDSIACIEAATNQCMSIYRIFENRVCKRTFPNYYTCDELCYRLHKNFREYVAIKWMPPSLHLETFEGPCNDIALKFAQNLKAIAQEFDEALKKQLPPVAQFQATVEFISFLGHECTFPPALRLLFDPYRAAVIFASQKTLPAIEKARLNLLERFSQSLEAVDIQQLSEHRDPLIDRLKTLCLFKLKPLSDLFVILRDIHAVLLEPEEGTEALEKGLHLIPQELSALLEPQNLGEIIDAKIAQKQSREEKKNRENKETKDSVQPEVLSEQLPLLIPPSPEQQEKIVSLLNSLRDLEKFSIANGEKRRNVLQRLFKLGVYTDRWNGGHQIVGHPNTNKVFSIPSTEILSRGLADSLEKWVHEEIFKIANS